MGYSPWGLKGSDTTEQLILFSLSKGYYKILTTVPSK